MKPPVGRTSAGFWDVSRLAAGSLAAYYRDQCFHAALGFGGAGGHVGQPGRQLLAGVVERPE